MISLPRRSFCLQEATSRLKNFRGGPERLSFILVRYLLTKLFVRFGLLLLLFVVIYGVIDYVETASTSGTDRLYAVYWYKLPVMLSHIIPVVLGASILLTVDSMKRTGEWTAIQMTGISSHRMTRLMMVFPLILLPLSFLTVHRWAPDAMGQFESAIQFQGMYRMQQYVERDLIVSSPADHRRLIVKRNIRGRAQGFEVVDAGSGKVTHHWGVAKTKSMERYADLLEKEEHLMPQNSINGIFAASVTSHRLLAMIPSLSDKGGNTAPFEATVSLRHGVALATFLVPLLSLSILLSFRGVSSAFMAVLSAIIASGLYWAVLMMSWQLSMASAVSGPVWFTPVFCVGGTAVGATFIKWIFPKFVR